jgi:hypothetical protein
MIEFSSQIQLFNAEYYEELLPLNPRISLQSVEKDNYWRAFLTGVKPSEIDEIIKWYQSADQQNTYTLASLEEWNAIYTEFSKFKPIEDLSIIPTKTKRISLLVDKLGSMYKQLHQTRDHTFTLKDQMLLQYGVVEWVFDSQSTHKWIGMGQPNPVFRTVAYPPEQRVAEYPINPDQYRLFYYGFRLLRK